MFWVKNKILHFTWINRKFIRNHPRKYISKALSTYRKSKLTVVRVKKITLFGCYQHRHGNEC